MPRRIRRATFTDTGNVRRNAIITVIGVSLSLNVVN